MKEETKSPQQILQDAREEFEKKFLDKNSPSGLNQKDFSNFLSMVKSIYDLHISTLQAFIAAEIKHLEGMKTEEGHSLEESLAYNQALQDQISHYKELKPNY